MRAARLSPSSGNRVPIGRMGAVAAPAGDRRRRAVAVEDVQYRKVGIEEQPDRLSDGREDLTGGRLLRDEYRHPAQRRLLLGERCHLLAGVGVRDCGRRQLREVGQAGLGHCGHRAISGPDSNRPPHPALDEDRMGDRGPQCPPPVRLAGTRASAGSSVSTRAERPVARTASSMKSESTSRRAPGPYGPPRAPITTPVPSISNLRIPAASGSRSACTSSAIA